VRHGYARDEHTIRPYARPSVELFAAYSAAALEKTGIGARYCVDEVNHLVPSEQCWEATTASGKRYRARNVVLAIGRGIPSEVAHVPAWASLGSDLPIYHVFDPSFSRKNVEAAERPVVVGGGVSAAHLALALSGPGRSVTLLARSELREEQFDSDPCYIGPKCYERYLRIEDPNERRRIISSVRNPGSIPPDLMLELNEARHRGEVRLVIDEITAMRARDDSKRRELELQGRITSYRSDACVLATGFTSTCPGEHLLHEVEHQTRNVTCVSGREVRPRADRGGLKWDRAGRPIPLASLEWAPGLFLTGILAEQELGPTAANIIGAHNAAKRIVSGSMGRPWHVPRSWKRYAPDTASSSSGVI
jgi:thioredoxin reductase